MTFRAALSHRVSIDVHFHHGCWWILREMNVVLIGQQDAGQQPVIEWQGDKFVVQAFHLSQQAAGGAFENALNTSFWRSPSSAFAGDAH